MQLKPEKHLYEYAILRCVPDAERGESINIGLVMMCKRRRWLRARTISDCRRIALLYPEFDPSELVKHMEGIIEVANGRGTSPIAAMEVPERFRWLAAVRSSTIRSGETHPGMCDNLEITFEKLYGRLVENHIES